MREYIIPVSVWFDSADGIHTMDRVYHFGSMSSARTFADKIRPIASVNRVEILPPHRIHSSESAFELLTAERI